MDEVKLEIKCLEKILVEYTNKILTSTDIEESEKFTQMILDIVDKLMLLKKIRIS